MYISRTVQGIREYPDPDDDIRLLIECEEDLDAVRTAIEGVSDAVVEEELTFETMVIRIPQVRIDDLVALDGIASIETVDVLGVDRGDAGEDVDFTDT